MLEQIHSDRVDLLMWAKTQTKAKKPWEVVTPWDDKGNCKFTYGAGNGSRKPQPEIVFTDVNGERLDQDQLSLIKSCSRLCLTWVIVRAKLIPKWTKQLGYFSNM